MCVTVCECVLSVFVYREPRRECVLVQIQIRCVSVSVSVSGSSLTEFSGYAIAQLRCALYSHRASSFLNSVQRGKTFCTLPPQGRSLFTVAADCSPVLAGTRKEHSLVLYTK